MMKRKETPRLTTWAGRFVDRITFTQLLLIMLMIIFCSAFGYFGGDGESSGLVNALNSEPGFGECVYFSIVTFTSLGYGDIHPIGYARWIACLEVTIGLVLLSIFVGKLASERSSSLIRLIYTSDHQRRLSEFSDNVEQLSIAIHEAYNDYDHERLATRARQADRLLRGLRQYLVFQSHQGSLLESGNKGSLRSLYERHDELIDEAVAAAKMSTLPQSTERALAELIESGAKIAGSMIELEKDEKAIGVLRHTLARSTHYRGYAVGKASGRHPHPTEIVSMSPNLVERVKAALPQKPWPKNLHKEIAKELSIPNRVAHKCISQIVRSDQRDVRES